MRVRVSSMRSVVPAISMAAALALAGCSADSPNSADRDRVAVMAADPVFAHLVDDPVSATGSADGATTPDTYSAPLDPWTGQAPPVGPTTGQRQAAVAAVLATLRDGGWTIISARCQLHAADDSTTSDSADSDVVGDYHKWEAFGYRDHDGVPYTVYVNASYADTSGFEVDVSMTAPFHTNTATYFSPRPPALAADATCIESGTDTDQASVSEGTVWSLTDAKSP